MGDPQRLPRADRDSMVEMVDWILAGVGDIAVRRVLPAILAQPESRLRSLVTRDPAKAEPYGVPSWRTIEEALAACPCDAVYLATPVALHAPQAIAAVRAGRHVLCEKPMSLRHGTARQMVDAAMECGKLLGVAYYRRLYPKLARAHELLAAGSIGRPVMVFATAHDWFNNEDGRRPWFLDPAMAGGGPLYDTASHRIDVCNLLFGRPGAVTAQLSNVVHQAAVEDSATVLIEYENKVRAIIDVRRHSRVDRDEFRITGTDGEMDLSPLNGPRLSWPGGEERLPPHENLHYPLVADFVSAVLHGTPLASSGETALVTEWVIAQAVEAAAR